MVNTSNLKIGLRLLYNPSWLGGVNYVLSLGRMLKALPEQERPEIVFLTASEQAEAIALEHKNIADQIAPIEATRDLKLDFVYPATQLAEASFGAPWAGWVPDWQCQHFPNLFSNQERVRRYIQYRALASQPVMCLFSSQQAIRDTKALFEAPPETTDWRVFHFPAVFDEHVWTIGGDSIGHTRQKYNLPDTYFIICNQFWRHKNHLVVLEALKEITAVDVHIVLTGEMNDTRWPDYISDLQEALDHPKVRHNVTLTGRIDREEQLKLLLGASGFVQPSLFEGWSTFVEEARAIGLPGLLSDIPVHREQSPRGAIFFDAKDSNDLAEKLTNLASDPPPKIDLATAKTAHEEYVLKAARVFLDIAKDAEARYEASKHDAGSAMLQSSIIVCEETEAFEKNPNEPRANTATSTIGPTRDDYNRFFAGLRHLLRQLPEELARVSRKVASMSDSVKKELDVQLVQATLQKMRDEQRNRFHMFSDRSEEPVNDQAIRAAMMESKKRHSSLTARFRVFVSRFIQRVINFARRKLT